MSRKATELPEDVRQICLWLVRGYERRKLERQRGRKLRDREWERMEAVEQAMVAMGADITSESVRRQLRTAILLNVESGRENPYERLRLEGVSRSEFYRRKNQFLFDIAARIGLI